MTDQELTEARILASAAPALLPLIDRRKALAFNELMGMVRDKKTEFAPLVNKLAALNDLEYDIKQKIDMLQYKEKHNARK